MRIHKTLLCSCSLLLGTCQAQSAMPETQMAAPVALSDELVSLTARPITKTPTTKTLIEYGGDMPTPQILQADQDRLAAAPFGGLTLRLSGERLVFRWGSLDPAQVRCDVAALKSLGSSKLGNIYLSMYGGAEGGWDWLSDADWAQRSVRLMVGAAKAAGVRGVTFGAEPYTGNPWDYTAQPGAGSASFEQMEAGVRGRGAAFTRAAQSAFPKAEIYALYLLSANKV